MSVNKEIVENLLKIVAEKNNIENYSLIVDDAFLNEDGFLSEFCTGGIRKLNTDEIIRFYLKLPLPIGHMKSLISFSAVFGNEIQFYNKLFPALDAYQRAKNVKEPFNKIPKFYYGFYDDNSQNSCIILEDLIEKGYEMHDKTKFFEEKHFNKIFYEYGKFHALGFAYKNENSESYKEMVKPLKKELCNKLQNSGAKINLALNSINWEDKNVALKVQNLKENFTEKISKVNNYQGKYSTLVHGDCWSNNIMFKFSNDRNIEDIKLVDFQMVQDSTPIYDLSFFFYSGGCKKDFDKLDDYLKIYYESFRKFSKELGTDPEILLPFESFKDDWKSYSLYGIGLTILVWKLKLLSKIQIKTLKYESNQEKAQEERNEILETDIYQNIIKDLINHAIEYGIL